MLINSVFHIIESIFSIGDTYRLNKEAESLSKQYSWISVALEILVPLIKEWDLPGMGIEDFDVHSC